MKKEDEGFNSLEELGEFFGDMIEKMERDFPFLYQPVKKTDGNVIHVDFNKEED